MLDKNNKEIFRFVKKIQKLLKRELIKTKKPRLTKQGLLKAKKHKRISNQNKKNCYYKCKICGKEIYWNTNKQYVSCECGAITVVGCQDYVWVIGDKRDIKILRKK